MKQVPIYTKWTVLIIGLVLIALRMYPTLFFNKVSVFGDNYSLQVPERVFTGYWIKKGILPWWNSTIFAGIPWSTEVSQTVFYPSTFLFTFLDPGIALNLTIALHLLFTYFGMFYLVGHWTKKQFPAILGAVFWAFSTQVTGASNNLVILQSIAWFPWVAYWGLRLFEGQKYILIFSLFILGQFLGGYPQHVVYTILLAVFLSSIVEFGKISLSRWCFRWLLTGFITLGLTAVAWVPFIEVFTQSTRLLQTNSQAGVGSLHPLMLVKMVLPYFFDNPVVGIKWGPAWSGFPNSLFYLTWLGLLAAVVASTKLFSKNRALVIFVIVSVIFSLGDRLPGFQLFQNAIPFFKFGRYPSMVLICTNVALVLLFSIGIERVRVQKSFQKWIFLSLFFAIALSIFFIYLPSLFPPLWNTADAAFGHKLSDSTFHTLDRDLVLFRNIILNLCVNISLTSLVFFLMHRQRFLLVPLILGIDMIFNTQGIMFFAPHDVYPSWQTVYQKNIPPLLKNPQYRTLTRNVNEPYTDYGMYWEAMSVRAPFSDSFVDHQELESFTYLKEIRDSYTPDWNMAHQLPTINGYTTLLPQNFSQMWQKSPEPRINFIDHIDLQNELLKQWSVGNYIVDKQFVIKESLPPTVPVPLSDTVDLYILSAFSRFRYEDNSPVDITSLYEDPNTIALNIDNIGHSTLTIADRYDQNWKATINGEPAPIDNKLGMREIKLHSGDNQLVLRFIPTYFYVGLGISFLFIFFSFPLFIHTKKPS